jgi:CRP-like cAMP-binding protein
MVAQSRTNVGIEFQADARARLMASRWLRECSPEFCAALLDRAIIRHSPAGARLFHAGDEGGGLFGIATGTVEISLYVSHPDTPIIHLGHGGYWAGYRPLVGRVRAIGVMARSDVTWALVPQHVARDLLAAKPEWWRFIARLADDSCEILLDAIADLTRQDSRQRAIAVLLRLAGCRHQDPPDGEPVELRLSQTELAAMAVMSRNTLNSIMRELVDARLVAGGYRTLLIRNPAALRAILAAAE